MAIFPIFFLGNIAQENIFYDILERKIAFLGYKRTRSQTRKIDIFPKVLDQKWDQKWPFFQLFFFRQYCQEYIFYDILEQKNAFLGYKNMNLEKSKNWHFSKGVNPWF